MTDMLGYNEALKKLTDGAFENGALAMRLHIMAYLDNVGHTALALRIKEDVPLPTRGNSP